MKCVISIALALIVVIGCKTGDGQSPDKEGYCMVDTSAGDPPVQYRVCNQYQGMVQDQMDEMANEKCTFQAEGNVGNWSEGSCPKEGRVGICQFPAEDITVQQHYYASFSLVSAQQSCTSINGSWLK